MSTIAERFKEIRYQKGWRTQADMAEQLGLKRQAIANVEAGNNNPSIETIIKLIEDFNVNANWLLAGKGDPFLLPPFEEVKDDFEQRVKAIFKEMMKEQGK